MHWGSCYTGRCRSSIDVRYLRTAGVECLTRNPEPGTQNSELARRVIWRTPGAGGFESYWLILSPW